jgi:glycogen operon protein
LTAFVQRMMALRRAHPTFRRRDFFAGRPLHGGEIKDVLWLKPDGQEMSGEEWEHEFARCLGMYLSGAAIDDVGRHGRPIEDDDFLVLFNAGENEVAFTMPSIEGEPWSSLVDTAEPEGALPPRRHAAGEAYALQGRSLAVLIRPMTKP